MGVLSLTEKEIIDGEEVPVYTDDDDLTNSV